MSMRWSEVAVQQLVDQKAIYRDKNPKSASIYERARAYFPGGNTRYLLYMEPHPIYADRGEGAYVWDVDGNKRLDMTNNFFSIIVGHANPLVAKAIAEQLPKGNMFGAATEAEVRLAQMICERAPSFERIRFANSGTEATMNALRVAKAYTGKPKFAKFEGGYHGTHDPVEVSISPPMDERAGPADAPLPVPDCRGLSESVTREVVILPWNDAASVERIVSENHDQLAAIIAEPVMGGGGIIPPAPGFLQELRRITRENGVLLIFDEVITLRLAPGGGQEYYGVQGDLVATGKIIGGGLPVGAFGGRADIMEVTNPASPNFGVPHSGTFSANPLAMVAGAAVLEQLTPEAYRRLNDMGDHLRADLSDVFRGHDIPARITGAGSLFAIHFTSKEVLNRRDAQAADAQQTERLFWWLTNNGVLVNKRLVCSLSTPMQKSDMDTFLSVVEAFAKQSVGSD